MTPPPQPEYIITEEQLQSVERDDFTEQLFRDVRSHPYQSDRDTVFNEKELQYLDCLIKKDIVDYPTGWCTLPHVEPALQQNVLKKIESLRQQAGEP
jgi:hypothetical protein